MRSYQPALAAPLPLFTSVQAMLTCWPVWGVTGVTPRLVTVRSTQRTLSVAGFVVAELTRFVNTARYCRPSSCGVAVKL